jgi:hypothetical protein
MASSDSSTNCGQPASVTVASSAAMLDSSCAAIEYARPSEPYWRVWAHEAIPPTTAASMPSRSKSIAPATRSVAARMPTNSRAMVPSR